MVVPLRMSKQYFLGITNRFRGRESGGDVVGQGGGQEREVVDQVISAGSDPLGVSRSLQCGPLSDDVTNEPQEIGMSDITTGKMLAWITDIMRTWDPFLHIISKLGLLCAHNCRAMHNMSIGGRAPQEKCSANENEDCERLRAIMRQQVGSSWS